jgi:hypothetical protein
MAETNIAQRPEQFPAIAQQALVDPMSFLTNPAVANHLWKLAAGYSRSQLVPRQFQGKTDDCFIICQLAIRVRVDPFMLMQATYIVHGRPGFEAKLAIAMLNASGKIKGTLKTTFSGTGDDYGCRASCIDKETGDKIEGPKVDWKMVKAEGWNKDKTLRDGSGVQKSKWNTMPDLMFVYRAASFLIRTNYPEVLMGMQTTEELADTEANNAGNVEVSNQDRLELLLAGTPEENPGDAQPGDAKPDRDFPSIDAKSAPAEAQSEQPHPAEDSVTGDAQPRRIATSQEADDFCAFTGHVSGLASLIECTKARKQIPKDWTPEHRQQAAAKIEMQEANIRGKRGERANGA